MSEPKIVQLEAGNHYICRCGKTGKAPFCDGSHKGTDKTPANVKMNKAGQAAVCMCGRTNTPPFCDGSHKL